MFLLETVQCWSNSGSDQVAIGTYDRKSYLLAKSCMFYTRLSSIMSILVHALNLRLPADERVDFSQSSKYRLSETSQRRWLECILTRVNFRTLWCSLIVTLLRTFLRHQLRLCMCYVNLSACFTKIFKFVHLLWQKRDMRIIHLIMHFPVFRCFYPRFLGSVGTSSTFGWVMRRFTWKHEGYVRLNATYFSVCILLFSADVAGPLCAIATPTSKRGMGDSWKVFYSSMSIQRT
jgi:hypothetical protein